MEEENQAYFLIVGQNIRRIRRQRGLSQHQLAARCRTLLRPKLSLMENGRHSFEFERLIEIAKALDVEVEELVSRRYYNEHGFDS